ncbi:Rab subfamily of small GTPases, partial [Halocaridina rubra]
LQIWDTAGQERFRTITQSYYRSANGVVIVYDITKRSSFLSVQRWMDEVRRYTHPQVAIILIGNKCDLETLREVEFEEAEALCEVVPEIMTVMEVSAKDNTNVEDTFAHLASELKNRHDSLRDLIHPDHIRLGNTETLRKWPRCVLPCAQ